MKTLNISEVRSCLPSLIADVARSSEIVVVTRYGKPVASIVPFKRKASNEDRYPLRAQPITVAADFDEPMPELWTALAVAERSGAYRVGRPQKSRTRKRIGRK